MTFVNKVLRYFKKNDEQETELAIFDSNKNDNYFQSFHSVVLENDFQGTIISLGDIHIKKGASFSGDLICKTCKIEGLFKGSLLSTEFTGVFKTAVLDARIVSGSIFIESDAAVKGIFNIAKNIQNPEVMKNLETAYTHSQAQINDDENSEKRKDTIVLLRGKPLKGISTQSFQKVEIAPADVPTIPVNTLTHPKLKMNRCEVTSPTNTNSGWW